MPAFDPEHTKCWVTWACIDGRNQKKYFDKAEDAQDKDDAEKKKKKKKKKREKTDDDADEKTKTKKKSKKPEPDAENKPGKRPRKQK